MISESRRRNRWVLAVVAGVVLALATPAFTGGAVAEAAPKQKSRLHAGEVLRPDEALRSDNGRFTLTQQRDGNLVLTGPGRKVLFDTKTASNPGATTTMQHDGNLVVKARNGRVVFDTKTAGNPGALLNVQDDGNVVVYSKAPHQPLWGLNMLITELPAHRELKAGHNVFSNNRKCRLEQQADGNVVVTGPQQKVLFDTKTTGNPGARSVLQKDGNFVVLSRSGRPLFDTKTAGNPGARLVVQDDCNVVLYAKDGRALWHAGSHV